MIHKRIIRTILPIGHHVIPHTHVIAGQEHAPIEENHRAHGLSLVWLSSYLLIFALSAASVLLIRTHAPNILGVASYGSSQIISLTNQKREANGLGVLSENSLLNQAASAKAADMLSSDYWAHNSPSGKTPWSFINAVGYKYIFAGENLARDFNDAGSLVEAWMNSPSHRSNLLDRNFKEIGVAVSTGKLGGREGILVVQMFGSAVSGVTDNKPVVVASPKPSPVLVTLKASPDATLPLAPINGAIAPIHATVSATLEVEQTKAQIPLSQRASVLGGSQFSITKGISLALVSFVFLLFAFEVTFSIKREKLHLRSGVLAHLGLLALVLLALWYAVGGAIL